MQLQLNESVGPAPGGSIAAHPCKKRKTGAPSSPQPSQGCARSWSLRSFENTGGRQMRIRIVLQLGLLSVLSAPMLAQADKTLLIDRPRDDDPVRVVKVMERAKEILPDGAHYANKYAWEGVIEKADDDWLTGLSLAIQNASAK